MLIILHFRRLHLQVFSCRVALQSSVFRYGFSLYFIYGTLYRVFTCTLHLQMLMQSWLSLWLQCWPACEYSARERL